MIRRKATVPGTFRKNAKLPSSGRLVGYGQQQVTLSMDRRPADPGAERCLALPVMPKQQITECAPGQPARPDGYMHVQWCRSVWMQHCMRCTCAHTDTYPHVHCHVYSHVGARSSEMICIAAGCFEVSGRTNTAEHACQTPEPARQTVFETSGIYAYRCYMPVHNPVQMACSTSLLAKLQQICTSHQMPWQCWPAAFAPFTPTRSGACR